MPRQSGFNGSWHQGAVAAVVLVGVAMVTGCAPVKALRSKILPTSVTTETTPVRTGSSRRSSPSFQAIVSMLQRGSYAHGERQLRQYLARHPGDRPAQAMLQQLTVDPKRSLGSSWKPYVVQSGDSYSSLAERYLGDSQSFLILARYNGSTNPSLLQAGETVRLPLSGTLNTDSGPREGSVADTPATPDPIDAATPLPSDDVAIAATSMTRAERLQRESLALLDNGQHDQAMARLGEALTIEPALKPAGPKAATLREQLLGSYHQRAIVLYRNQKLDQAIALWDRILAINPAYEPAVIYRARALDLKQRLKQI